MSKYFPKLSKEGPSLELGDDGYVNSSRRNFMKHAAIVAATATGLVGCNTEGGNEEKNAGPEIKNSSLNYATKEGTEKKVSFSQIIADAGITDKEKDKIILEAVSGFDNSIRIDTEKEEIIFHAPAVDTEGGRKNFSISFKVKDSKGVYSEKQVKVNFTSIDENDDLPLEFNNSDLIMDSQIKEGEDFTFHLSNNVNDTDGIDSIYYVVKDANQNTIQNGEMSKDDTITVLNSKLPVGQYTISVLVNGVDSGEGDNSSKAVTKGFEVVADKKVEIKNIVIPSTITKGDKLTGSFDVPADNDGLVYVKYEVLDSNNTVIDTVDLDTNGGTYNISYDTSSLTVDETYTIKMKAKDNGNTADSQTEETRDFTVEAANEAPTLNLTLSGSNLIDNGGDVYGSETGGTITFDMSGSSDFDGNVIRYVIELENSGVVYDGGDSSFEMSTTGKTYGSSEKYHITVYDDDGTASTTKIITINYDI